MSLSGTRFNRRYRCARFNPTTTTHHRRSDDEFVVLTEAAILLRQSKRGSERVWHQSAQHQPRGRGLLAVNAGPRNHPNPRRDPGQRDRRADGAQSQRSGLDYGTGGGDPDRDGLLLRAAGHRDPGQGRSDVRAVLAEGYVDGPDGQWAVERDCRREGLHEGDAVCD